MRLLVFGMMSGGLSAQEPQVRVISGVAYDSLRGTPLAGATLMLSGESKTAISDSAGRFTFYGQIARGYVLTLFHQMLDSIGVSGISIQIPNGLRDTVLIATPSFASLWRVGCGDVVPPLDGGFVFGTVRDARTLLPLGGILVAAGFSDFGLDSSSVPIERRWSGQVRSDPAGSYALCGTMMHTPMRMIAAGDSLSSGIVDVQATGLRVRRRDFFVGKETGGERGVVTGIVQTSESRQPLSGARVSLLGAGEVRTAADGRFVVRDAPLGTRQLEVAAIGLTPVFTVVDVLRGDTADVAIDLERVTVLENVKVRATSIRAQRIQDMEKRRSEGHGLRFMDSTELRRYPNMAIALSSLKPLAGAFCAIYIDGTKQDLQSKPLAFRSPADFAQIEVHTWSVPIEFTQKRLCPVLLTWTKNGLP